MDRFAIAIGKRYKDPLIFRCFIMALFILMQSLIMLSDLIIIGVLIGALFHPVSFLLALFTFSKWKESAFIGWKKENMQKFYNALRGLNDG